MEPTFRKKVILITGCSSGFGFLTAARLASRGHRVFATMRTPEKGGPLNHELNRRGGGQLQILRLDVTEKESIQNAVSEIMKQHRGIDVLINNAGYAVGGFFEDLSEEDIRQQMETNYFGVLNVTREVLPIMRKQKRGQIINVSSVSGRYALPAFGAYNSSKWALEGFSESLSHELYPFGIKVSLIEPGAYRTKIFYENRRYAQGFDNPESPYYQYSQNIKKSINEAIDKDNKDPEDIAKLIERMINNDSPRLRYIPDGKSRRLIFLRTFLPFRLFAGILRKSLYERIGKDEGS